MSLKFLSAMDTWFEQFGIDHKLARGIDHLFKIEWGDVAVLNVLDEISTFI